MTKNDLKDYVKEAPMRWSGIVVHHSATKDDDSNNWKAIIRYHTEHNKWSDVGYHFGIEKVKGQYRIFEGRPLSRKGAHVKESNYNSRSIGICVVGNYDIDTVPKKAWNLLVSLIEVLQDKFDIPTGNVIGHWEAQQNAGLEPNKRKTCPGKRFDMVKLRQELS